ncbi:MAG: Asp-tRNA(Asn)/Glu-tRNA(Gln) amidotransferase subunit GatC [Desulfobacterales bacterium]|jgi:aspartyl-tRNA(Asn)/glutamyl-tRNA(Gln) amidotransferase subunit C
MRITRDQVLHVARLARLELADEAVEKFSEQLAEILDYVEILNQADTQGVAATSHVLELTNAFREDEPGPQLEREAALANAPQKNSESFLVPKVVG